MSSNQTRSADKLSREPFLTPRRRCSVERDLITSPIGLPSFFEHMDQIQNSPSMLVVEQKLPHPEFTEHTPPHMEGFSGSPVDQSPVNSTEAATPCCAMSNSRLDVTLATPAPVCRWDALMSPFITRSNNAPESYPSQNDGVTSSPLSCRKNKISFPGSPISSFYHSADPSVVEIDANFYSDVMGASSISRLWKDGNDSGVSCMKSCTDSSSDDSAKKIKSSEEVGRMRRISENVEQAEPTSPTGPCPASVRCSAKDNLRGRFRMMKLKENNLTSSEISFEAAKPKKTVRILSPDHSGKTSSLADTSDIRPESPTEKYLSRKSTTPTTVNPVISYDARSPVCPTPFVRRTRVFVSDTPGVNIRSESNISNRPTSYPSASNFTDTPKTLSKSFLVNNTPRNHPTLSLTKPAETPKNFVESPNDPSVTPKSIISAPLFNPIDTPKSHTGLPSSNAWETPKVHPVHQSCLPYEDGNSLKVKRATKYSMRMQEIERKKQDVDELNSYLGKNEYNENPFVMMNDKISSQTLSLLWDEPTSRPWSGFDKFGLPSRKRLALNKMEISRYQGEFVAVREVGSGQFGRVFECINRLDGCTYAIKSSRGAIAGTGSKSTALNEVFAYSALSMHENIVKYFGSWVESRHIYLQTEFCNGGTLDGMIQERRQTNIQFKEEEIRRVLWCVSKGLRHMHSRNLVHLDVKPENILVHHSSSITDEHTLTEVTYKLCDLGHTMSVFAQSVEEGDCRYLPLELIQRTEDRDLTKADVYSLALTVYEMGSLEVMPKNGPVWQEYRQTGLPNINHLSSDLNLILKSMSRKSPSHRPSMDLICRYSEPQNCSESELRLVKSSDRRATICSVTQELEGLRASNEVMREKIETLLLHTAVSSGEQRSFTEPTVKKSRLIGRGIKKSRSNRV